MIIVCSQGSRTPVQVEPPVFDTPLKAPVFTRFFEEPLLLYPRLHRY